jgi:NADPH:quinone reductase-like Zn-dependent oxidoreductase
MTAISTMRAATVRRYGDPEAIRLETVPRPNARPGEVRVRVHASPVTAADVRIRSALAPRGYGFLIRLMFGLRGLRQPIPGSGFAGTVDAIGEGVTDFAIGQRVFGLTGVKLGAHAEYLTIAAAGTILELPETLSFEEGAAFFFGGLTATDFLIDKAQMQRGESLAVVGATGSVGTAALWLARHLGLVVTAVASVQNHDLARSLGATTVLDSRTQQLDGRFDGILDVMGTIPRQRALSLLRPGGRLMPVTPTLADTLGASLRPRRGTARITGSTTSEAREKLVRLVELHRTGGYRPVVGLTLPFAEISEAHRIAQSWHKRGNLVLRMLES